MVEDRCVPETRGQARRDLQNPGEARKGHFLPKAHPLHRRPGQDTSIGPGDHVAAGPEQHPAEHRGAGGGGDHLTPHRDDGPGREPDPGDQSRPTPRSDDDVGRVEGLAIAHPDAANPSAGDDDLPNHRAGAEDRAGPFRRQGEGRKEALGLELGLVGEVEPAGDVLREVRLQPAGLVPVEELGRSESPRRRDPRHGYGGLGARSRRTRPPGGRSEGSRRRCRGCPAAYPPERREAPCSRAPGEGQDRRRALRSPGRGCRPRRLRPRRRGRCAPAPSPPPLAPGVRGRRYTPSHPRPRSRRRSSPR